MPLANPRCVASRSSTVKEVECFHCHGSFNFSAQVDHAMQVFTEAAFFNNGLYNVDGRGAYPAGNRGLYEITFDRGDMGHFKPPSLRNIAVTAPYMHDGTIATLVEVIDFYAAGGRNITEGPNIGDGRDSPLKNSFVRGFHPDRPGTRRSDRLPREPHG